MTNNPDINVNINFEKNIKTVCLQYNFFGEIDELINTPDKIIYPSPFINLGTGGSITDFFDTSTNEKNEFTIFPQKNTGLVKKSDAPFNNYSKIIRSLKSLTVTTCSYNIYYTRFQSGDEIITETNENFFENMIPFKITFADGKEYCVGSFSKLSTTEELLFKGEGAFPPTSTEIFNKYTFDLTDYSDEITDLPVTDTVDIKLFSNFAKTFIRNIGKTDGLYSGATIFDFLSALRLFDFTLTYDYEFYPDWSVINRSPSMIESEEFNMLNLRKMLDQRDTKKDIKKEKKLKLKAEEIRRMLPDAPINLSLSEILPLLGIGLESDEYKKILDNIDKND